MKKSSIINDINFKKKCREYGLNWNMVEIYETNNELYLYIPTIDLSHIVIMDKKYNVIGIEKKDLTRYLSDIIDSRITLYTTPPIGIQRPFLGYSMKNINDLANYIEIDISNQVSFNNKVVNNKTIQGLLAYFKLLQNEMSDYYLRSYHLIMQGYEVPNMEDYIVALTKSIDFKKINNTSDLLRNLGLWYQKKDELTKIIRVMISGLNKDTDYNNVNELSNTMLYNIKNTELIKK